MTKKLFNPYTQNIDELFLFNYEGKWDRKRHYVFFIPDYQRQYSWLTKNVKELWDDFYGAYKTNKNECYFLGYITLIKMDKEKKYCVIDGQQRITTLVIMLSVLYHDYGDKINKELLKKIGQYLFRSTSPYVLTFESDKKYKTDFYDLVTGEDIDEETTDDTNNETEKIKYKEVSNDDLKQNNPKYKYKNTARIFYKKFGLLDVTELNDFINYIINNVNVITIISENESIALKMFESLNDRGLKIDNADIIKSWLYSKCGDNKSTIGDFKERWDEIIEIVNNYDFNMNDFMSYYCYYKLKSNPKLSSSAELKEFFSNSKENVIEIIQDMKSFAMKIDSIYKSNNKYEIGLLYIPWKGYVMTALAGLRKNDSYTSEEKELIIQIIHKFYYIAFISNANVNGFKQTAFNLIQYIVDGRKIEDIEEMLLDYIYGKNNEEYKISSVFNKLKGNVYDTSFLKNVMLALEFYYQPKEEEKYIKINKDIHLDHIIPQKYYKNKEKEWDYLLESNSEEEIDEIMNTLGNMALLSSEMNINAKNYGYKKKYNIYHGKDDKIKLTTKFKTTQIINNKNWTMKEVKKRQDFLYDTILKMLDLDEKRDSKISVEFLGTSLEKNRWEDEQGNRYYDKDIIKKLLTNSIVNNNVKKYEDISNVFKNEKMLSYPLITKNNNKDISREKIKINGIELYLLKAYLPALSREFICKKLKYNYDPDVSEHENIELIQKISQKVLEKINSIRKEQYISSDINAKKPKTYIQFFGEKWNKGIHFEIISESKNWIGKNLSLEVALHIENNVKVENKEKLFAQGFSLDDEDEYTAYYEHTPIKEYITVFFDPESEDKEIDRITNILYEMIKKYSDKIETAL